MPNRPYLPDGIHASVIKYAKTKNITKTEAYIEIIKRSLDEDGNLIDEITNDTLKHIEQSKQELTGYISTTPCKWCKSKAQIIYNALEELIQLHKKGREFVDCLNHSDNINALEEAHAKE